MSTLPTPDGASAATATPLRQIAHLLDVYGASHKNPINELIHFVAIPMIVFSLIGLLHWIHPNLALVVIAGSIVYYARLSTLFMVSMALMSALMLYVVGLLGPLLLPVSIGVFVVSWIFQFIGHKIEGKKPSFFDDLRFLLIGPLFVLGFLYRRLHVEY